MKYKLLKFYLYQFVSFRPDKTGEFVWQVVDVFTDWFECFFKGYARELYLSIDNLTRMNHGGVVCAG